MHGYIAKVNSSCLSQDSVDQIKNLIPIFDNFLILVPT